MTKAAEKQQNEKKNGTKQPTRLYRLLCRIARWIFPKFRLYGTENLPAEPCIIVGNHSQAYGPVAMELYAPRPAYTWCVGEVMNRKEAPAYTYRDFWPLKRRGWHWFYRMLSRLTAGPLVYILNNARLIPVYRDARVVTTFTQSIQRMKEGADIVIFPEKNEPYNPILCQFQEHFPDLARLYHRMTGAGVQFVPMYIAPKLKGVYYGKPICFDPDAPEREEKERIRKAVMASITDMAVSLPRHTVVPYLNIPRREYPLNTAPEQENRPD